jgi:hypothetical protein
VWKLSDLWTHRTRPQGPWKSAQNALSHSYHTPSSFSLEGYKIREWNHATAVAMLTGLDTVTRTRPRNWETELWRMRKDERECRCVVVYLPTGIAVRLFEGDEMRRTWLVPDKWSAQRLSAVGHAASRHGVVTGQTGERRGRQVEPASDLKSTQIQVVSNEGPSGCFGTGRKSAASGMRHQRPCTGHR